MLETAQSICDRETAWILPLRFAQGQNDPL
jgi:hypothetical protein